MTRSRVAVLATIFVLGFGTVVALTRASADPPCDSRFVFSNEFAESGPAEGSETFPEAVVAGLADYLRTRPQVTDADVQAAISQSDAVEDAQSGGGGTILLDDLPDDPQLDVLLAKDGTWIVSGGSFCTVRIKDEPSPS